MIAALLALEEGFKESGRPDEATVVRALRFASYQVQNLDYYKEVVPDPRWPPVREKIEGGRLELATVARRLLGYPQSFYRSSDLAMLRGAVRRGLNAMRESPDVPSEDFLRSVMGVLRAASGLSQHVYEKNECADLRFTRFVLQFANSPELLDPADPAVSELRDRDDPEVPDHPMWLRLWELRQGPDWLEWERYFRAEWTGLLASWVRISKGKKATDFRAYARATIRCVGVSKTEADNFLKSEASNSFLLGSESLPS